MLSRREQGNVNRKKVQRMRCSAIFYRDCAPTTPAPRGGMQNNTGVSYIYFWGWTEKADIPCMKASYPEMYAKVLTTRPKLSLDDLRAAETKGVVQKTDKKGTPLKTDAGDVALANEVAAEMVGESWRDFNVKYINLMLLDIAQARKVGPEAILAGYCAPLSKNIGQQCKNTTGRGNGIHPIAWSGALDVMMTNHDWGHGHGATSTFGSNYEAGLIGEWLIDTQKGKPLSPTATCTNTLPTDKDPDRLSVVKLFDSLLGNGRGFRGSQGRVKGSVPREDSDLLLNRTDR